MSKRKTSGRAYEINGEVRTVREWAEARGVPHNIVATRLSRGKSIEEALAPAHTHGGPRRRSQYKSDGVEYLSSKNADEKARRIEDAVRALRAQVTVVERQIEEIKETAMETTIPRVHPFAKYIIDDDEGTAPTKLRGASTANGYDPPEVEISADDHGALADVIESYGQAVFEASIDAVLSSIESTPSFRLDEATERRIRAQIRMIDFGTIARGLR